MNNTLNELYNFILARKENPSENSYTAYLFEKGLDKILKKCGEECSEVIIAAKNSAINNNNDELKNEIADLIYHIIVLCAERDLNWSEIEEVLSERGKKTGNLKQFHNNENDVL